MEFSEENVREQMESLANGIVSALNKTDPVHSRELLSQFVSELFLSVTKQALREERRKKPAELRRNGGGNIQNHRSNREG